MLKCVVYRRLGIYTERRIYEYWMSRGDFVPSKRYVRTSFAFSPTPSINLTNGNKKIQFKCFHVQMDFTKCTCTPAAATLSQSKCSPVTMITIIMRFD